MRKQEQWEGPVCPLTWAAANQQQAMPCRSVGAGCHVADLLVSQLRRDSQSLHELSQFLKKEPTVSQTQ